jgi:hypothetical protein
MEREFAVGDRLGFTASSKELGIANYDLGTVQQIDKVGQLAVNMDNGKSVSFDANQMRTSTTATLSPVIAPKDSPPTGSW